MFDVYSKEVRSILEHGVPVWHPGLTRKDSLEIERIQKSAFHMILGTKTIDYKKSLHIFQHNNFSCQKGETVSSICNEKSEK